MRHAIRPCCPPGGRLWIPVRGGGAADAGGGGVPLARRADPRRALPRRAAAGPRLPAEPRPRSAAPHVPAERRPADHGEALRRLGGADGRAARPQPRPLPDGLRAALRGHRRRAAEGPRPRPRCRAAEGAAGPARPRHAPRLPLRLPRGALRPRRGAQERLGALLHPPQDPGGPPRRAPGDRRPGGARGREGHGRVGGPPCEGPRRRAVAGDARDRVRRDAGRPDGALRHDGGPRAPAARPPLRSPERLRPPRPGRGPARRPAREHPDPEGHRRRPRLRGHGRGPLLRGVRDVLAAGRAPPLLRHRGPQRGRALLAGRAPLAPPRPVHRRDLQHLQHAEAHAPALPPGRRPLADRLLRARPLQPHPRLAGPRHGHGHLLRRSRAGSLAQLLDARGLVLVLRGDRDGEPGPLRRGDLRAAGRGSPRRPLPRLAAHVAREGPDAAPGDTLPGRGPDPARPAPREARAIRPAPAPSGVGRRTASR